jgi:dUTP pyrophosphatase
MFKKSQLKFVKHDPEAKGPTKTYTEDAGYDLFSLQTVIIPSKQKVNVTTGIAIELPKGTYGRIADRSSLANKSISVIGGVIDPNYRGSIDIIMINLSEVDYEINKGDRIAQLICEKCEFPEVVECAELSATKRNTRGFGSTGK